MCFETNPEDRATIQDLELTLARGIGTTFQQRLLQAPQSSTIPVSRKVAMKDIENWVKQATNKHDTTGISPKF
jgi:hypothetical protein